MTGNPVVSVILVTYNASQYLERAVRSVLTQALRSVELIIVDGGSTDTTLEIIGRIGDDRLRWISEPDEGIYDAMNKGIKLARGKWLYFLGADDFLMKDTVLEDVFSRELNESDIVYGDVYSVLLKRNYDGPTNPKKLLFSNLCHQSIFYNRTVFEKAGFYDLSYKLFSDWEFNIRCFADLHLVTKYVPVVIAEYSASGLSTVVKDVKFIRNYLFAKNLEDLRLTGIKQLNNIRYYDQWWRLLRSMKTKEDLHQYAGKEKIPRRISKMHSFQKHIPQSILFKGVFSKMLMMMSYVFNI